MHCMDGVILLRRMGKERKGMRLGIRWFRGIACEMVRLHYSGVGEGKGDCIIE